MSKSIRLHEEIEQLTAKLLQAESRVDALELEIVRLRADAEKRSELNLIHENAGLQAINEDLRAQLRQQTKANVSLGDWFRELWLALKRKIG